MREMLQLPAYSKCADVLRLVAVTGSELDRECRKSVVGTVGRKLDIPVHCQTRHTFVTRVQGRDRV